MEKIKEETVNGRRVVYVRYTAEEKAEMKRKTEERRRKKGRIDPK